MKSKFKLFFIYFLSIIFVITFPSLSSPVKVTYPKPIASSPDYGVSNYTISQNVKYYVEINFSLIHKSINNSEYLFKFARMNDRQPSSSTTQFSPPYQESKLIFSNIIGSNNPPYLLQDKFNNTYDVFNNTLSYGEIISLNQKYNITLNEVVFKGIKEVDSVYNMSDNMFELYSNNSELYYERNNTALIDESNNIVAGITDPILKAKAIYNWVSAYLEYTEDLPAQEKGALWAYNNEKGDCSEYSSLMITLLRIQNIPARKVTGFLISNNPATRPHIGDDWEFTLSRNDGIVTSDFLGHAWVEYYVPEIGWIASDPTWGASSSNYFNKNDYLRFHLNVGQWFPIPELSDDSEFPNPCIVYDKDSSFEFNYQVTITVIEANLTPLEPFPFIFIIFIVVGTSCVVISLSLIIRKRKTGL
ncbi:hypothetical protein LCGC14_1512740 [marine sediment metagenome]|uniref:Transglutaminase-like domain-containing protein n=1 Tax=marine sediment metagenome TaxID=412755 RepID=A0A0F9J185_9ZZZZ